MNTPRIQGLVQSLCAGELPAESVWLLEGSQERVQLPPSWVLTLASLQEAPSTPAKIVALPSLSPTLVRQIVKLPPDLLVLTAPDQDPAMRKALLDQCPDLACLGPSAGLWVNPQGQGVQLALDAAQLQAGATPDQNSARLRIAPTPDWILPGLLHLQGQDHVIHGWVDTQALDPQWRALLEGPTPALLAAHCPTPPSIDAKPWDPGLEAIALAHDLAAPIGLAFPASHEALTWLAKTHQASPEPPSSRPLWVKERWDELFLHSAQTQQGHDPELPSQTSPLRQMPPLVAVAVQQALTQLHRWQGPIAFSSDLQAPPQDAERSLEVLQAASEQLTDHESKVVLKGWGFEVTRQAIGKSTSAALSYAQKLGYPVALKAISPQLRHKARANCVALGVTNAAGLKRHYQKINDLAIEVVGEDQLDGVLVSEMVPPGLDIQIRALKGSSGQWSLVARCHQGSRKDDASAPTWTLVDPEHDAWAHRFAKRVIPLHHPEYRQACEDLSLELEKLNWPLQELGDRLFCVDLDPLRIFVDPSRPPTVLDAYIEQDAHIQGL